MSDLLHSFQFQLFHLQRQEIQSRFQLENLIKSTHMTQSEKMSINPAMDKEGVQLIPREGLRRLTSVACSTWQTIFREKAAAYLFEDKIPFTNDQVDIMFIAADGIQTKILNEFFTKSDPIDNNALLKDVNSVEAERIFAPINSYLFGNSFGMGVANGFAPPGLENRCLFISALYKAEVIEHAGKSIIKIFKR